MAGRGHVRILVFCPNWVGDLVMASPTLRALRQTFPAAHLTGLMRPSVAETLAGNPWLDETILYHHRSSNDVERSLSVLAKLRKDPFDIGVLLTNSIRTALLAFLGGVKRRVGYAHEGRRFLLNDVLSTPRGWRTAQQKPLVDYYLELARHLGATDLSRQLELFTTPDNERHADRLWEKLGWTMEDRVVVLNPGAAYGSAKRWPSRYFAELARRLVDEQRVKVLVLCGPRERGFARFIADASLRPRQVHSMAEEEVSLGLAKAAVRRANLLVTTDSGPRHFGAAFSIPVVSLFGPTHIGWTETYHSAEIKLQQKLPCGPCQQRECPLGHLKCMVDLSVNQVHQAAITNLERCSFKQAG
jgi:heptosyltransferase-2